MLVSNCLKNALTGNDFIMGSTKKSQDTSCKPLTYVGAEQILLKAKGNFLLSLHRPFMRSVWTVEDWVLNDEIQSGSMWCFLIFLCIFYKIQRRFSHFDKELQKLSHGICKKKPKSPITAISGPQTRSMTDTAQDNAKKKKKKREKLFMDRLRWEDAENIGDMKMWKMRVETAKYNVNKNLIIKQSKNRRLLHCYKYWKAVAKRCTKS